MENPSNETRQRLLSGEPLSFDENEPELARTIESQWLKEAVDAYVPIKVKGAVIKGELNLKYSTIAREFNLYSCDIRDFADFSHATFEQSILLIDSRFHGGVNFKSAAAKADFHMSRLHALAPGRIVFDGLDVRGTFTAEQVHFGPEVLASFREASFAKTANFDRAHFENNVDFSGSLFCGNAEFKGSRFGGLANFEEARIERAARFDAVFNDPEGSTVFAEKASFTGIHIGTNANFERVIFQKEARFENANVGGNARFSFAEFKGEARFAGIRINGQMVFFGAIFRDETSFNSARVAHSLQFTGDHWHGAHGVTFEKVVDFGSSVIGSQLQCDRVIFNGIAIFNSMKVEKAAFFRHCVFKADTDFVGMQVATNLEMTGASFDGSASFDLIEVGGMAQFGINTLERGANVTWKGATRFHGAQFGGCARFDGAEFGGDAEFVTVDFRDEVRFHGANFNKLASFVGARVGRLADFRPLTVQDSGLTGAKFKGRAVFDHARFDGDARFDGVEFRGNVSFRETSFRTLFLSEDLSSAEAQFHAAVDLRGCTYNRLNAEWRCLLMRPNGATRLSIHDRQPYTQLEQVLREAGRDREADDVHFKRWSMENRNKYREVLSQGGTNDKIRSLSTALLFSFYRLVAGYGVKRTRVFIVALVLLLLGAVFYTQPGVVSSGQKPSEIADVATNTLSFAEAFEVSLHQFFPIELPIGSQWEPSAELVYVRIPCFDFALSFNALWIASLLRVFGWLLVPLGVAAIAGLLRRVW